MIIAERVASVLAELGVSRAYGLPGEDHMNLLDAFAAAGVDYCTAFNESSAVLMAATDAQVTGRPGVALLSLAPGVSNGMNGILHAHLEGLPVLVLSGQHAATRLPFVVRQGFDIEQMVRPAAKWTSRVPPGLDPASLLCKAMDLAMSPRPGPVYLELPDEVAAAALPETNDRGGVELLREEMREDRAATLTPSARSASDLAERLARAQRPVLVVGGRRLRATQATLALFAETFRCPVFVTSGQKGAISPRCPYFAGTFLGGNLEARLLQQSDLVIAVNLEGFDVYNRPWPYAAPMVGIVDQPLTDWLFPFDARIAADPEVCLRDLTKRLEAGPSRWTLEEVREYRAGVRHALLGDARDDRLSVALAVDTVLAECGDDTVVVADAGFSKPIIALLGETNRPGHYLASNGLSTMGFAIPAAIGAGRALDAKVVAFLGDGSLLMRGTELFVARSVPVPPVFVAIIDRSLSQIEIKQRRRDLTAVGVELPELSCQAMATAFGIRGVDVTTREQITAALRDAGQSETPLLLGIHVDPTTSPATFEVLRG